jgi:predicted regulator of Ras-like GTPase activity (Roadblock/LC7/MglB family)
MSGADTIQMIMNDFLVRDDVLGAVAADREGLVLAAAGMPPEQAALVAALGAPLANVSDRAMTRLGSSAPELLTIDSTDGMLHVRGDGNLTLIVLTERCATIPLAAAMQSVLADLAAVVTPVVAR